MAKTYSRIDAVRKTANILKFLGDQREPVSPAEVSKAVEMPTGTVMCHLVTLEECGFAEMIGEKYRIGMGAAMLWARYKSLMESDRARIDRNLNQLDGGE
ncbi:MAG: IclR family transcriptional regulator [Nitrospirae bacterium]|nr:MAG: IclR family transcriptional regulator [Nitrospirota bacterium]